MNRNKAKIGRLLLKKPLTLTNRHSILTTSHPRLFPQYPPRLHADLLILITCWTPFNGSMNIINWSFSLHNQEVQ